MNVWNRAIIEYLIKWKNFPIEEETWKDELFMQEHPELIKCWGQHLFEEEVLAKPYILWHYIILVLSLLLGYDPGVIM